VEQLKIIKTNYSYNFSSSIITTIDYVIDGIKNNNQLECHFNNIHIQSGYYFLIGCIGGETTFKKFNSCNNSYLLSNNTNSVLFTMFNYSFYLSNNNSLDINNNINIPSQLYGTGVNSNSFILSNNNIFSILLGSYQHFYYNTINASLTNDNIITPDGGFGGGSAAIIYDDKYPIIPSSGGYLSGFSGYVDTANNSYINNYAGAGGSYWNNSLVTYGNYSSKNNDTFGYVKVLLYSVNSIIDNTINNNYILSQQELDLIAYCLVHILYILIIFLTAVRSY
jgi:hypothetical protein